MGLRFQINSAAMHFEPKPWATYPMIDKNKARLIRKRAERVRDGAIDYYALLDDESSLGLGSFKDRLEAQKSGPAAKLQGLNVKGEFKQ